MRFFGKDGVGKTDTSPLKIFIANLSMSLYWKETWDCFWEGWEWKVHIQVSFLAWLWWMGFTSLEVKKYFEIFDQNEFVSICISPFGRGGGGKSLFRKTFGSLEKPSQRLGMGLGLCEELIGFKSCTILFPFFPFSPLRIHKIRIKVEPSVGIWECPFIPGRAGGRETRLAPIGWCWLPLAPIGRYCQGRLAGALGVGIPELKKKCPILYGRKQTNRQTRPCTTVRNSECQLLEGSG